jgi:hypothetical protein
MEQLLLRSHFQLRKCTSIAAGTHRPGGELNITALWAIAPCSLVEVDGRLKGSYCLHHQGDGGGSTHYGTSSLGSGNRGIVSIGRKAMNLGTNTRNQWFAN